MSLSYDRRKSWGFGSGGGGGLLQTFTIWDNSVVPAGIDSGDPLSVTVGLKFQADTVGTVIGVRFYKAVANIGLHVGLLYDNAGVLLNSVNFAGETASGWQQQLFAAGTPILATTTYIIAYFAPSGHYSVNNNYFTVAGFDNPPLHALSSPASGGNGVFTYGAVPTFPINTFADSNYWVDLVFQA